MGFTLVQPAVSKTANTESAGESFLLQGIIFCSNSIWTIWINGEKLEPHSLPKWIRIHEVSSDKVKCSILKDSVWNEVTLYPQSKVELDDSKSDEDNNSASHEIKK